MCTVTLTYDKCFDGLGKITTHGNALAANRDIRQSGIRKLWDPTLLFEVEGDIPHVGLDLAEVQSDVVRTVVLNGVVRAEFEVILGFNTDDIREQVLPRESQILDNEIERIISVLDTRNRDKSDLE